MIQPNELKYGLPVDIAGGQTSTTTNVWQILRASYDGDLNNVKELLLEEPNLAYAQYNYMPPIHLAVREGHAELVNYFLELGAFDPSYRTYPFRDDLVTIAQDADQAAIADQLLRYSEDPSRQKFKGDNGGIHYPKTPLQQEFEDAVNKQDIAKTETILKEHPEFALDETFFWGEGILMMPAKEAAFAMLDLLMDYGATVPTILKWTQAYYFKRYDGAVYMMKKGMSPNVMSVHHVTILHDMAQKGDIQKAELLLQYGAEIDPVDEEYQSTPLGLAARWGNFEMVKYLLQQGADPNKGGRVWSTPLAWAKRKNHESIVAVLKDVGAITSPGPSGRGGFEAIL